MLQYVQNFPKGEKYVSLLKDAADPEAQIALDAERERLRALVRQRVADEIMLSEVNEGVLSPGPLQAKEGQQVSRDLVSCKLEIVLSLTDEETGTCIRMLYACNFSKCIRYTQVSCVNIFSSRNYAY